MEGSNSAIDDLVRTSGNSFHARVARWFASHGWKVTISPFYMDDSQGKAREIDLIVERLFRLPDSYRSAPGDVLVRIYVECKYIGATSAFWFSDKNREMAMSLVCSTSPFKKDNRFTNDHHYISKSERVAKLFATSQNKNSEVDPIFKAINQVLNAYVSYTYSMPRTVSGDDMRYIRATLEYQAIFLNSFEKIYRVDFEAESTPTAIDDNFQLEVLYAYKAGARNQNDFFLIDVVDFNKIEDYVSLIEGDVSAASSLLNR